MANYPDPCKKCERKNNCTKYMYCNSWKTRYIYRQKQINAYAKKVLPGYSNTQHEKKTVEEKDQSPCKSCTRVKDPYNCGQKTCEDWKAWFFGRWKLINGYAKKQKKLIDK